jgi:TolB-like protein/DNA-binding CsgD family transcriptional regulator/Tfp pilus assembly protein PilF
MKHSADHRALASPADLGLTERQVDVLALMMQGKSNKAISRALDLAEPTVKKHVTAILDALQVTNRTEAVIAVGTLGWKLPPAIHKRERDASASPAGGDSTGPDVMAYGRPSKSEKLAATRHERRAEPPFALPDKPSIVVLPFANLSGSSGQDYFADGIVEEITVALGRLPWLFVIASSSAFTYKGRTVDARRVGADLGVRYLLRGSVRKDGHRLRILVQLDDASYGGQVWADRFEGDFDHVFDLQDRVTTQVSTMIAPALRSVEIERAKRKPTENLTAYDLFLRALSRYRVSFAQNQEALRLLYKAINLDPSYGAACGLATWCYNIQRVFGWARMSEQPTGEALRLAHLAVETGKNDAEALWMAARTLVNFAGELEYARDLIDSAISLNPNLASAWWSSGLVRAFLGETDTAIEHLTRARRLNPLDHLTPSPWIGVAWAQFAAGRYEDAQTAADQSLNEQADFPPALRLKAATCGLLGRAAEGRHYVERLLAVSPDATVTAVKDFYDRQFKSNQQILEKYLEGLRVAGLPAGKPS